MVIVIFMALLVTLQADMALSRDKEAKGAGEIHYACPAGCSEWTIDVDVFGYSDWLWFHPDSTPSHEMLSGDWAAAIYYDGIETSPQATWLTDYWICPYYRTAETFEPVSGPTYTSGDQSAGTSTIRDRAMTQVEIQIDYELVCDGPVAMNIGSGLFVPSTDCIAYVTYTIKNTSATLPLTNVYFYQLLHGHPGDEYDPEVTGRYDPAFIPTYNQQNYHWDISMWAKSSFGNVEYIGFSVDSTLYPFNRYDVADFRDAGGNIWPATGLNKDVENRVLLNRNSLGPDCIAGAMEWSLGTISPLGQKEIKVMLSMSNSPGPRRLPSLTGYGLLVLIILLVLAAITVIVRKRRDVMTTV